VRALILEQSWSTAFGGTKYCQRSAPGIVAGSAHSRPIGVVCGSWTSPSRMPTARCGVVQRAGMGWRVVYGRLGRAAPWSAPRLPTDLC